MENYSYYPVLGVPLIVYMGFATLLSLAATALISTLNRRGVRIVQFKWHSRMAKATMALALVHGIMGITSYM